MIINNRLVLKALEFTGQRINSPEQRLIQGATALMTQPFFDLNNNSVDEDTRMMSVARTLAKIIVGTAVGVLVRQGSISLIRALSKYKFADGKIIPDGGKIRTLFLPLFKNAVSATTPVAAQEEMNLYQKGMGTLIGTLTGIFTNFLIDAPGTKHLTGVFYKKITGKNKGEKTADSAPKEYPSFEKPATDKAKPSLLVLTERMAKK